MKLGNAVFYTLEGSRQKYLTAVEAWPYVGGVLSVFFFVGFALRTPLHAKLLKETAFSVGLGMLTATAYPWYYKRIYETNVCTVYSDLRLAIKRNPALAKPDDSTAINKNFGPSKWNPEYSLDSEEEMDFEDQVSIFDGDAQADRKMMHAQWLDSL